MHLKTEERKLVHPAHQRLCSENLQGNWGVDLPEPVLDSRGMIFVLLAEQEPNEFRVAHFVFGMVHTVGTFDASRDRSAEYSLDHTRR